MANKLLIILFLLISTSSQAREIPSDPYIVPDTAKGKLEAMAVPFTVKAWVDQFSFDHRYRMELFLQAGMDINAIEPQSGSSALYEGITENDPDLLSWLFKHGASLPQLIERKPDLLSLVLSRASTAVIEILLNHGINIDHVDTRGSTALHHASTNGASNAVQRLLDMKANINSVNHKGETPLALAANYGRLNAVKILIKNKVNINATNQNNKGKRVMSALANATNRGHYNIVSYLLEADADIDYICLEHAVREQRMQILELLLADLKTSDSYNESKQSVLQFATSQRNRDAVTLLLKNIDKLSPDIKNISSSMHTMITENSIELLKTILPHMNLQQEGIQLVNYGISYTRLDIVALLLDQITLNNDQRNKLIIQAVSRRFCDAIPLLADKDITLNENTISMATATGDPDCVRALLQAGANPDTTDSNGNSLLMTSAERGYISIINLLLAAGADKYSKNKQGQTALDIATSLDYRISAKLLSD